MSSNVQIWSSLIAALATLGGREVVGWLVNRGKIRSDDAAALRKELREDNREKDEKIDRLERRIEDLEKTVGDYRMRRIHMWRVLHENNVSPDVLEKLRMLDAS
jgi:hypothetical protein